LDPRRFNWNPPAKAEGRNPKAERRPNSETESRQLLFAEPGSFGSLSRIWSRGLPRFRAALFRHGDGMGEFGPRASTFSRPSAFGFRTWGLLAALLCLSACRSASPTKPLERFEFSHPAMGTLITITLYAPDPTQAKSGAAAAFQRIDTLEDIMSDYEADSELMRLCDQPFGTPVPVSAELFDVLQRGQKISQLSDGAFDVTVGPYIRLWRFARKRKVLPTTAEIEAARAAVGWQKLRLDARQRTVTLLVPNMRLDLGSIGKGYAADAALRVLKGRGIDRALVAASGDIAIGNPPPGQRGWKVGIAAFGRAANSPLCTLLLHNAGISTSGDTEQFIEINGTHYSHIVNPATGLGLTNRIQATVIGPDATTTDCLDTTVSLLGVKRGLALIEAWPHLAALVVTQDNGQVHTFPSRRFPQIPQAK
jgi:FAD:protein FMN transferase